MKKTTQAEDSNQPIEQATPPPSASHRGWPKGKPRKPRRDRQEPSYRLEKVLEELQNILSEVKKFDAFLAIVKKGL